MSLTRFVTRLLGLQRDGGIKVALFERNPVP
jgi:hypothetical protein